MLSRIGMENGGSRLVGTTRARETTHFADEEGVFPF